ncbi:adhesion G protein-coupled receptor E3-like isoform X1 [Engraulis encrasicolus]|uniref:adhesion G protein-coupled receptor E3-like isoform X1 n=1 Tax=Engraulis encrasicolus TaxID=184585 RepID=UPI002FD366CA
MLDIDLIGIAKNNNGSAAVALTTLKTMSSILHADFFHSINATVKTMMSPVLSASLPKTHNKALKSPAKFTIKHSQEADPLGQMSCVYWNGSAWLVDGCDVTDTNSTHTICTCVHFSTFSLIMQTERPPEPEQAMTLLNRILVAVGLGSLTLALLTFALCHKKTTVATPARVNLCASLLLSHLLFLLVQEFIHLISPHKVVCSVLSGVLHVLFLSSFAWMFLETIWLLRSVLRLKEFRSAQNSGPHWGYQCLVGYGAPFAVVAISAGLVPEGYGSDKCWLKFDKGFVWSFLGPVCCVLGMNTIIFFTILIHLRSAISKMQHANAKLNRTLVFKTLIQTVIIGAPWILGFFTKDSDALDIIFHVLSSQQGTFIFLLHCVLNQEVQREYWSWFRKFFHANRRQ